MIDLKLNPWLKGGEHSSECLPAVAEYVFSLVPIDTPWLRILDAGCGNGELLRILKSHAGLPGAWLYGCDIEADHIVLARKRTGIYAAQFSWCDFACCDPFPGKRFDVIVAIGCLHNNWCEAGHSIEPAPSGLFTGHYLSRVADRVAATLTRGGCFIYDWPNETRESRITFDKEIERHRMHRSEITLDGGYVIHKAQKHELTI